MNWLQKVTNNGVSSRGQGGAEPVKTLLQQLQDGFSSDHIFKMAGFTPSNKLTGNIELQEVINGFRAEMIDAATFVFESLLNYGPRSQHMDKSETYERNRMRSATGKLFEALKSAGLEGNAAKVMAMGDAAKVLKALEKYYAPGIADSKQSALGGARRSSGYIGF